MDFHGLIMTNESLMMIKGPLMVILRHFAIGVVGWVNDDECYNGILMDFHGLIMTNESLIQENP